MCDDEKSVGVTTDDETFIPADIVISDIHPVRTLELVDSKLIRNVFRNRISSIRNTTACFSVYLHFKKDRVPYMNSNYFGYKIHRGIANNIPIPTGRRDISTCTSAMNGIPNSQRAEW